MQRSLDPLPSLISRSEISSSKITFFNSSTHICKSCLIGADICLCVRYTGGANEVIGVTIQRLDELGLLLLFTSMLTLYHLVEELLTAFNFSMHMVNLQIF